MTSEAEPFFTREGDVYTPGKVAGGRGTRTPCMVA